METLTSEKTITVTGKGSIHIVPDVTRLEVTINGLYNTYHEAYEMAKDNSKMFARVMDLANLNVKLPKTTKIDITEHSIRQYDKYGNFKDYKYEGYDMEQHVKIDLGMDNNILGKVLSGIGQFVPNAQINVGYTVKDPRPSQMKILERAVKDAKEKATIMAEAADCKLGLVKSIVYSKEDIQIYSQARNIHSNNEALACNEESLDITPNDLVVSDEVNVVWFLSNNLHS